MNDVSSTLEILLMATAIAGVTGASVVGALVGLWKRVDSRLDARIRDAVELVLVKSVEPRFDAIDRRFDRVESRLDRVESRLDRVDLRLDHLEGDMTIVKQRLIGVA